MEPIRLEFFNPPVIGETSSGQRIYLGGFSGLRFLGRSPIGLYQFVTHTDRGPNTDAIDGERPFGLPDFQPRLVFLDADVRLKKFFVRAQVPLTMKSGRRISGRPREDSNSEVAVDFKGKRLVGDHDGLDLEGVALASDGTFWLCDEYGPSLVRFSTDGVLLDQISPGKGLPETLRYRRLNRGFEGVAITGNKLYAALESPLDNPPSAKQKNSRQSHLTRIVEVDLARRTTTAQFSYMLEEADTGGISDLCMETPESMLVIEKGKGWKRLYRFSLAAATNLQRLSSAISGPGGSLERMTPKELAANGIAPVRKNLRLDLTALGMDEEKFEGVDRVDDKFIALITDNDFGLAGGLDRKNGVAETKEEKTALYFVPLLRG
ncbi:MAG: esterase-like activity of phytase family protein [Bdellovibrionota bacterium]